MSYYRGRRLVGRPGIEDPLKRSSGRGRRIEEAAGGGGTGGRKSKPPRPGKGGPPPPSGGGSDPSFANVTMLYHFFETAGATTYDDNSATNVDMIKVGGSPVTEAGGPYGNWLDNPIGSYSARDGNTADSWEDVSFTWEFLFKQTSLQAKYIFDYSGTLGSGAYPVLYSPGTGTIQYIKDSAVKFTSSICIGTTVTHAICYQRNTTTGNGVLFVDGVNVGEWVDATDYGSAAALTIRLPASSSPIVGKYGEVRVTIGTARYDEAGYTPATTAFPDA